MRLTQLNGSFAAYDAIYLSPHLDDAALSCGATIATQTAGGMRVLVVTLCTAAPPADGPFSALAQEFHAEWGLTPEEVVSARLREDERAMELLGCDYHWAGLTDALYRLPTIYNSRKALFGAPAANDPLHTVVDAMVAAIRSRAPDATLYGPLGVGGHVDHQVTYAALRAAVPNAPLYEDLPYALQPGSVQRRLTACGGTARVTPHGSDAAALQTKLAAVAAYQSQLAALFSGEIAMRVALTDYAAAAGGERTWVID